MVMVGKGCARRSEEQFGGVLQSDDPRLQELCRRRPSSFSIPSLQAT